MRTVTDPRQVEPDAGEPGSGQVPGEVHVQPVRTHPVHHAGIDEHDAGAGSARRRYGSVRMPTSPCHGPTARRARAATSCSLAPGQPNRLARAPELIHRDPVTMLRPDLGELAIAEPGQLSRRLKDELFDRHVDAERAAERLMACTAVSELPPISRNPSGQLHPRHLEHLGPHVHDDALRGRQRPIVRGRVPERSVTLATAPAGGAAATGAVVRRAPM